jgi:hypothetical protein
MVNDQKGKSRIIEVHNAFSGLATDTALFLHHMNHGERGTEGSR